MNAPRFTQQSSSTLSAVRGSRPPHRGRASLTLIPNSAFERRKWCVGCAVAVPAHHHESPFVWLWLVAPIKAGILTIEAHDYRRRNSRLRVTKRALFINPRHSLAEGIDLVSVAAMREFNEFLHEG